MTLKPPYPWFGGKSSIASVIWDRFGDVRNFVDPFFGSGAVLLNRPMPFSGTETVNDYDGMVANFWRATQAAPDEVASYADWPVNECDLHARHLWLVNEGRRHVERLKTEYDYYDARIAGWWVWGICQWIGSGWCTGKSSWGKPFADGRLAHEKLPHLGNTGQGVHRPSQNGIYDYFAALSERLRGVRVCCGDWSRVCGPTPTAKLGLTAVILDPPYSHAVRDPNLYAEDNNVAADVRGWCVENGDNPKLRIVLCGYEGEGHEALECLGWTPIAWKAAGGYGNQSEGDGRANAGRERLWCSPHCQFERTLFDAC